MKITVSFTGLPETLRLFDNLAAAVKSEVLASSLMAGAQPILNDAKVKVPVRTGNLRRSLMAQHGQQTATSAEVEVGTSVDYAPYVEYGTSRMRNRAYLRPAFDEQKGTAVKEIEKAFRELVTEEIQNLGPRGGQRK